MPIPGVMAGALARRTKNCKIAVLGRALPLLNNPLTVAEEFAMLDTITGGRLIAGFVRGIGAEYHAWGANPAESHDRFHEAHDLIMQALDRDRARSPSRASIITSNYVNVWPRPYQQPHPPIWIPSQGIARDHRMGRASRPQIHLSADLQPGAGAGALHADVSRHAPSATASRPAPEQCRLGDPDLCAPRPTRSRRREAKPHIEFFFNKLLRMPQEMLLPPGYLSLASMQGVIAAKRTLSGGVQTIDDLMEKAIFLCGSPATLREKLEQYQAQIGFGYLLPTMQFGTLPHELVTKSTELFAKEVIPHFRGKADQQPARRRRRFEAPVIAPSPLEGEGITARSTNSIG